MSKIQDNVALTYFGIYRGPSLTYPGTSYQPTETGDQDFGHPQSIESYVTTGYKMDKNTILGVATHFYYRPVLGQDLQMYDPALMFSRAELIHNGNFKLKGMLYVNLPLTAPDILQKQNLLTSISPTVVAAYDVPGTALSLGTYAYITGYVPGPNTVADARTIKIYAAPNASYQFTKSLAGTMWVDLIQLSRNQGTGFFSGMTNDMMDLEPGVSWDITPNFTLNPIINFYPGTPTLQATSVQAVISAKML